MNSDLTPRPYGLWDSPVGAGHVAGGVGLRAPVFDSDGRTLVWLERRGADSVLVARRRGEVAARDLTLGRKVRARVFYGGGEFTVSRGTVYFVEDGTHFCVQSLEGGDARRLTPDFGHPAAPTLSRDGKWLACVHSDGARDAIAVVDAGGQLWPQRLAAGADFYMQPAWHPRGRQLAWLEWDFPNMAWDGCRLVLASLRFPSGATPVVDDRRVVAGGDDIAVFQPAFSPDGRWLAWASDEGGDTSRLWLHDLAGGETVPLTDDTHGDVAQPGWVQGMSSLAFAADGLRLWFTAARDAERRLYACDLDSRLVAPVAGLCEGIDVSHLATAPRGDEITIVATTATCSERILTVRGNRVTVQARATGETLPAASLSAPRAINWPAADGTPIHGIYYPPAGDRRGSGQPPLLVDVHGGPSAHASIAFDAQAQYFATRGWAVLFVNHRGSTGYGRRYLTSLRGNWGVYDVEDAVTGARHVVDDGLADPDRLVISGGSAGGYTVLRALTLHPGFFRAGVCRYGISDLFALGEGTAKFESRYSDTLLGPLPEAANRYRERSPLFSADAIRDPVILFQGTEDEVVPRAQSDALVDSLRARNVPHEYHVYEGEGHGFRRPETRIAYVRAVDAFLRRHVLFA